LSTLTKILIVLLTLSSIFLCGIVVTYVANAENYKEQADKNRNELRASKEREASAIEELNQKAEIFNSTVTKRDNDIAAYKNEIDQLEIDLATAEREKENAQLRQANYEEILVANNKTLEENNKLRQDALEDAANLKETLNNYEAKLDELTYELLQVTAIRDDLEKEKTALIEENSALQNKVDRYLQQYGYAAVQPVPVTTVLDKAQEAPPIRAIALEGNVRTVNMQKSLIEISIGAANGVKENMVFHVTRGDKFICDLVIFEVDNDKAVGIPELVQEPPQAGDTISTNL
jgi:seryl-tRNA synthetase